MTGRCLEDFAVGQTFHAGPVTVHAERMKAFAAEFDPQPFHLDEHAARDTIFGGLVASGWHTAAITIRLLVESDFRPAEGPEAPVSRSSAGRAPYGQGTSCASWLRSSSCGRRDRVPIRA